MTAATFRDWASKCAIPEIKRYCHNENISFKALILLDNAPSHPIDLDHIDENVRFVFMPPNTTSIIQPMDQGVISNFKAYYLRRSFKQLFTAVETDDKISIKDFWKSYNILAAVSNIAASWAEVSKKAMNGCWKSVWPECVEGAGDNGYQSIDRISVEVSEMATVIGLDGMETNDIVDLININSEEELDNDELFELDNNQSLSIEDEEPKQALSNKRIPDALKLIDEAANIFINKDLDTERSLMVAKCLKTQLKFMRKFTMIKQK